MKTRILFFFLFLSANIGLAGGSVGNGGDVLTSFLESSRYHALSLLERLAATPSEMDLVFASEPELTTAQKEECHQFLVQTAKEILDLNKAATRPEFLVRTEPLLVVGPDGKLRPVDAKTDLGPEGGIEVNDSRVRFLPPFEMLKLVTHEFGHKVKYLGSYVTDNDPIGAFSEGRQLLDAFGLGIARYAVKKGIIGSSFVLHDYFQCLVSYGSGLPLDVTGSSVREFLKPNEHTEWRTSIGYKPRDLSVSVRDTVHSRISLKVQMSEGTGCDLSAEKENKRMTEIGLVRNQFAPDGSVIGSDEVLAEKKISGWNPICSKKGQPIEIETGQLRFECRYKGSQGDSPLH